jgi:hypothetical protein
MAVEIRELIIKATIVDDENQQAPSSQSGSDNKDQIVEECVEQVMQMIKSKTER